MPRPSEPQTTHARRRVRERRRRPRSTERRQHLGTYRRFSPARLGSIAAYPDRAEHTRRSDPGCCSETTPAKPSVRNSRVEPWPASRACLVGRRQLETTARAPREHAVWTVPGSLASSWAWWNGAPIGNEARHNKSSRKLERSELAMVAMQL